MLAKRNPQLNQHGELIHLLSTEGLPKSILTHVLDTAKNFVSVNDREVKKVPLLRGKSVFNLFFEPVEHEVGFFTEVKVRLVWVKNYANKPK